MLDLTARIGGVDGVDQLLRHPREARVVRRSLREPGGNRARRVECGLLVLVDGAVEEKRLVEFWPGIAREPASELLAREREPLGKETGEQDDAVGDLAGQLEG